MGATYMNPVCRPESPEFTKQTLSPINEIVLENLQTSTKRDKAARKIIFVENVALASAYCPPCFSSFDFTPEAYMVLLTNPR